MAVLRSIRALLLLAAVPAAAQEPSRAAGRAAPAVPLIDGLGSHRHRVTASPEAQRYFDQGLRLAYAFNHAEAIAAFEEGARRDPQCAMCWWGVAYASGPNINVPMDPASNARALDALGRARAAWQHANSRERAYIEALERRHASDGSTPQARLDSAYASAMRDLMRAHPTDTDAATLYADAMLNLRPWNQWTRDGRPQPGTPEVLAALEGVLRRDARHPGACHLYIHAVEASPQPERALPCAERLPKLMPAAGHLVHMPAHLYMRLGRYAEVIELNKHAVHADERYIADRRPEGVYPTFYYPHNIHFIWYASTVAGRSGEAMRAARQLASKAPLALIRRFPMAEAMAAPPLYTMVRFGQWEAILKEPAPPRELRFTTGAWHWARGIALVSLGRTAQARQAHDSVAAIARQLPPELTFGTNRAQTILEIASGLLEAELLARDQRPAEAARAYERAIAMEDSLTYDEPPGWFMPVRQSYGAFLLQAGDPAAAERVYREDLAYHRENGWSLYGLAEALRAQGKAEDALAVDDRLRRAWAHADVRLAASRF